MINVRALCEQSLLIIFHKDSLVCLFQTAYCFICRSYIYNPTKIDIYECCNLGPVFPSKDPNDPMLIIEDSFSHCTAVLCYK